MSNPDQKGGLLERIAHGYFVGEQDNSYISHEYTNYLTKEQDKGLKKIKYSTLALSAAAGTLGVLLLYLPPYYFPQIFALWTFPIHLAGFDFDLALFSLLYGILLAVAEIFYLVFLNIRAVRKMALVCNFPPKTDPNYQQHIISLINIGVEKNAKNELSIGLNPWQGYSKFRVTMIFVWSRVRATLSNIVFKMILRRILGRYAVRVVVEIAGVPVMAGWNMWAANKVMMQARVRILSPGFIQQTVLYLSSKYKDDEKFKDIIYDVLQFLAVRKRTFHENHYLLSVNLLKAFDIPFKNTHEIDEHFFEKLQTFPEETQDDLAHLIIIGMIVDGHLSYLERQSLDDLSERGIIEYTTTEVEVIMNEFIRGQGKEMLDKKLKMAI